MPGGNAFGDLHLLFETDHGPDQQILALTFDPHTLELIHRVDGTPKEAFSSRAQDLESFYSLSTPTRIWDG
ncbi:MAG: hypothetical protein JKY66_06130 [Spongiibacteraceae bacterium]|nr:hypothetical protein [Spongiibacteraceae bacterium]